jgi:hypothetical protein
MIIYGKVRGSLPRALHQRRSLVCWFSSALRLGPLWIAAFALGHFSQWHRGRQSPTPRPVGNCEPKEPIMARGQPVPRWGNLTTVGRESATGTHATAESLTSTAVGVKPQDVTANQASISMLRR